MPRDGLSIALLALLAEAPASPSAVRDAFASRRHDRIVAWDDAALAACIDALRGDGLVEGTESLVLTEPGRAELVAWTRSALAEREHERPQFDLALLTAHSVPVAVAREALAERLAELDDLTSQLTTRIRTSARRGLSEEYSMQADYRRNQLVAEFTWLSRLLERLDSGELTWRVGAAPTASPETA